MGKLTTSEIDDYFKVHLPYRTRILLAHYKMTHDSAGKDQSWNLNPAWLDACFVASLVTGRLYLNVLGIGKDKKGTKLCRYQPRANDITVDDLDGMALDPTRLLVGEEKLFLDFMIMADRAAAHFTILEPHDSAKTHNVVQRIHHYLQVNLYDASGRRGLQPLR